MTINISQAELMRLAEQWEPEASQTPPGFRKSKCVVCGQSFDSFWHCWLDYVDGEGTRWKKELHFCWDCGREYA